LDHFVCACVCVCVYTTGIILSLLHCADKAAAAVDVEIYRCHNSSLL
jgi:hypothetical protein